MLNVMLRTLCLVHAAVHVTAQYQSFNPFADCVGCSHTRSRSRRSVDLEEINSHRDKFEKLKLDTERDKIIRALGLSMPSSSQASKRKQALKQHMPIAALNLIAPTIAEPDEPSDYDGDYDDSNEVQHMIAMLEKAPTCPEDQLCVQFFVSKDLLTRNVQNATLWLSGVDKRVQEGVAFQITDAFTQTTVETVSTTNADIWYVVDVTRFVDGWIKNRAVNSTKVLQLSLATTDIHTVVQSPESDAFIEISHSPAQSRRRRDRPTETCNPLAFSRCCVQKFFVNFTEIDLPWILRPSGYWSNYCTGNCRYLYRNGHEQIMNQVVSDMEQSGEGFDSQMIPCCAPRELGSIDIVYVDDDGVMRSDTIKDMRVTRCGC